MQIGKGLKTERKVEWTLKRKNTRGVSYTSWYIPREDCQKPCERLGDLKKCLMTLQAAEGFSRSPVSQRQR